MIKRVFLFLTFLFSCLAAFSQNSYLGRMDLSKGPKSFEVNNDESKVPSFTLPDPLIMNNGKRVRSARQWVKQRRGEILEIFSSEMYGPIPPSPDGLHFKVLDVKETELDGLATQKTVRIFLDRSEQHWFDMMLLLPNSRKGRTPVFAGLNFCYDNEETFKEKKGEAWPFEMILQAGFGVATAVRHDIEPEWKEYKGPKREGLSSWYAPDCRAISAWAWGLSRIMDYLETDSDVDARKVAVIGHSRLGKTALWAAANDQRFSLVISNCSGACGAAISRRRLGERFSVCGGIFPYWFCDRFQTWGEREDEFPADQHWLAALIAPRPLYIASATDDLWADPRGEWLTAASVGPVYRLFGKKGLSETEMPSPDCPDNNGTVAYHIHTGRHMICRYNWEQYIAFARRQFKMK